MRLSLLASLVLGLSAVAAHADTVTTFNLTDVTLRGGSAVSGTVTIDVTTGKVTSGNVTTVVNGSTYTFTGAPFTGTANTGFDTYFDFGSF